MNMTQLRIIRDERGDLIPIESRELPFLPKRFFYVTNVPVNTIRGGHAHYETMQFLICIKGKILVDLESFKGCREVLLEANEAVFIDKMVWDYQKFLTEDAVLLVICSTEYNLEDYILEKKHFLNLLVKNE